MPALRNFLTCPSGAIRRCLAQQHWPSVKAALEKLHKPDTPEDVATSSPPWQRIAYDELLAGQLALALVRKSLKSQRGRAIAGRWPDPRQDSEQPCRSR